MTALPTDSSESATDKPVALKPKLRGYIHQEAFYAALGACILLIAKGTTLITLAASLIYSFGLLVLFGISAIYHRVHWEPKARAVWKRLDHSAIFVLIAGTITPVALLSLPAESGRQLILIIWSVALAGILQSIFWVKAPKWCTALFYLGTGWIIGPYLPLLTQSLQVKEMVFLYIGGFFYTIGAVFYALKKPNFVRNVFGYHELFHACTVIAAAFHFMVIYKIVV